MFKREIKVQFNEMKYGLASAKGLNRTFVGNAPASIKTLYLLSYSFILGFAFLFKFRFVDAISCHMLF